MNTSKQKKPKLIYNIYLVPVIGLITFLCGLIFGTIFTAQQEQEFCQRLVCEQYAKDHNRNFNFKNKLCLISSEYNSTWVLVKNSKLVTNKKVKLSADSGSTNQ